MAHPYTRTDKIVLKCVKTQFNKKAATFLREGAKFEIGTFNTFSVCALTDGSRAILHKKNGPTPEFEEGATYILKNFTLSNRPGQLYILLGKTSMKFRTAPLVVSEEAERAALDALCPPSHPVTGEEEDLFLKSGYLSLKGKVEKLEKPRMTRTAVPILDLKLRCGEKLVEVSLWRDQALYELHEGDIVHLSHLRATQFPNGNGKMQSSNHTAVKVEEVEPVEEEIEVVGVSEVEDTCHILSSSDEIFKVPPHLYLGNIEDIIKELPLKLTVIHKNKRIVSFKT